MKVLFSCGNAPGLPTGYGGQGLLAVEAFQRAGATVCVLAWNLPPQVFQPFQVHTTEEVLRKAPHMARIFQPRASASLNWEAVTWLGNPYASFPATIRKADMNRMIGIVGADLFVSLQDIFMFEPGPFACLSAVWMPLHFVPVEHPTVLALADFDMQLPISGWGSMLLQPLQSGNQHAVRHISVLGHGRDINVFTPDTKTEEGVVATRRRWNWPLDAFVVLLIASNSEESGRKALDAQLQGFSKFVRANPDKKIWLHMHTEVTRAYDVGRLLETFGEYDDRACWTDVGDNRFRTHREAFVRGEHVSVSKAHDLMNVSETELVNMYHAADVLLAATCSEGCGVPILEAQLCGTPVITTKATAMWEETQFGISVKPLQWLARMDFNSGWMLPHAQGIANALAEISAWTHADREERLQRALPVLRREFSNDSIVHAWGNICNIVKTAINTNFESSDLQLSHLRKLFLRTSRAARIKLQELEILEEELRTEMRALLEPWSLKQAARELKTLTT